MPQIRCMQVEFLRSKRVSEVALSRLPFVFLVDRHLDDVWMIDRPN